jgi:hypothetical protein
VSDHVEFVEGDFGIGQMVADAFDECRRHIDGSGRDVVGVGSIQSATPAPGRMSRSLKRLRKKFNQTDASFDMIETLYGVGYRFKE